MTNYFRDMKFNNLNDMHKFSEKKIQFTKPLKEETEAFEFLVAEERRLVCDHPDSLFH